MKSAPDLESLKIQRSEFCIVKRRKSFLNSCCYPILHPWAYLKKLWHKLTLLRKKSLLQKQFVEKKLTLHASDHIYICIRITGGIGDVVCITRWIAQLKHRFGESLVIDVFFTSPDLVNFILEAGGVRSIFSDLIFRRVSPQYDISISVNQFITFNWCSCKIQHIFSVNPDLIAFAATVEKSLLPYRNYIASHPALDGIFSDQAVKRNLNRKDFLSLMSGFNRPSTYLDIKLPDDGQLNKYSLSPKQYITVHDGWDKNFKMSCSNIRPTKSYPTEYFSSVITYIKKKYPKVKIVQIGGQVGSDILGVDINLKGQLSLHQSALVLKHSLLHIDTESGLVHMATSIGVLCVVIFGPTNYDYYSYPENKNIKPESCGNCMWVTDSWMEKCPLGYSSAQCTSSIAPEQVLKKVSEILDD